MFIAHDGGSRFQISNAAEVESAQDAADGGRTQAKFAADPPAVVAQAAKSKNLFH